MAKGLVDLKADKGLRLLAGALGGGGELVVKGLSFTTNAVGVNVLETNALRGGDSDGVVGVAESKAARDEELFRLTLAIVDKNDARAELRDRGGHVLLNTIGATTAGEGNTLDGLSIDEGTVRDRKGKDEVLVLVNGGSGISGFGGHEPGGDHGD